MRVRPREPLWHGRDMFFLSKGHCTPAYYAVMAARGYLPHEELLTFRAMGSRLQGHPSNTHLPGVDSSSGSLGQGLSIANGAALAARYEGLNARYSWCWPRCSASSARSSSRAGLWPIGRSPLFPGWAPGIP